MVAINQSRLMPVSVCCQRMGSETWHRPVQKTEREKENRYRDEPNEIVAREPLASHPSDVYTPDTTCSSSDESAVYTFSIIIIVVVDAKMFVGRARAVQYQ